MIDDAMVDHDLRAPPKSFREALPHPERIPLDPCNSQRQLVLRWDGGRGEAEGVNLDDRSHR
jgi:hypothetical protein